MIRCIWRELRSKTSTEAERIDSFFLTCCYIQYKCAVTKPLKIFHFLSFSLYTASEISRYAAIKITLFSLQITYTGNEVEG